MSDDLWRTLDRLDVIHRSIQPLTQAAVADRIREVSGAADVLIQAETEKQLASQRAQADEVRAAVAEVEAALGLAGASWSDPRWDSPVPTEKVDHLVRLGQLRVGLPANLGIPSIPVRRVSPSARTCRRVSPPSGERWFGRSSVKRDPSASCEVSTAPEN